jgi:VanZ family protein
MPTGKWASYVFRQWLPALVGVGCIALESTDLFSSQHTGSFLYALATALFGPISLRDFEVVHHLLRKTGHFAGYGILALLFFRALRNTVTHRLARLWLWSVALTAAVASLDEWHQSFIPSRTSSIHDVLLDTAGAAFMVTATVAAILLQRGRSAEA